MKEHFKITRIQSDVTPDPHLSSEMIHWGKIMGYTQMAPYINGKGWAGNIGFRQGDIIWVTPSGGAIDNIQKEAIVGITVQDNQIVYWANGSHKPTCEWEIYWVIFNRRKEIYAVLHGHDLLSLETAEMLMREHPEEVALTHGITEAGSAEFRDQIAELITDKNTYLIGREHGFFCLGKSFEESGKIALEYRRRAIEFIIGREKYQGLLDKYHIGSRKKME